MNPGWTQPYDEAALIHALKAGNQKAFEELYDRFAPSLMGVIQRILADSQQAEDVLQDSFVKIWLSLNRYDPSQGRLFTWLLTITRNTALSQLRARNDPHDPLHEVPTELTGVVIPDYHTVAIRDWVTTLLNENELRMIDLMYFRGYTYQQISDELAVPLGSVKTYVRRALGRLRNNL